MARLLRIAVSVFFALLTVPLVMLWVRSYSICDSYSVRNGHRYTSLSGMLYIDETFSLRDRPSTERRLERHFSGLHSEYIVVSDTSLVQLHGKGVAIPHAVLLLPFVGAIAAVWTPLHFSLRTLLIATTLVAAALGLGVWLAS